MYLKLRRFASFFQSQLILAMDLRYISDSIIKTAANLETVLSKSVINIYEFKLMTIILQTVLITTVFQKPSQILRIVFLKPPLISVFSYSVYADLLVSFVLYMLTIVKDHIFNKEKCSKNP